jgi:LysR family transcriptional regulator, nitrogen assimilation regulatory protein
VTKVGTVEGVMRKPSSWPILDEGRSSVAGCLDTRRLRYFVAVCELGSFSKASEFLNVAQSALSQHVGALEEDLGVELLLRRPRGISRTEAGDRLLAHARGVLHMVEQAELDVRMLAKSIAGPVMVGLSYTAMEAIGLPFVQRVTSDLNAVKLRVLEAHSEILHQWMLSGEVDLAVTFFEAKDDRLEALPLLDEELVCIGRRDQLGEGSTISFNEILQLPLIMPGRLAVMRALVADAETRQKLTDKIGLEVEGVATLKRAVAAGLGCSIQSAAAVTRELESGSLVARRVINPPVKRTVYLMSSKTRMASRAVIETHRLLVQTVREAHAAGLWPGVLH